MPSFVPPESVRAAARHGLELRRKYGKGGLSTQEAGRQGIGSGVARASSLAAGKGIPLETIKRMSSFFSRHEKDKAGGPDDAGYISWLLWGGDPGRSWANQIIRKSEGSGGQKLASKEPSLEEKIEKARRNALLKQMVKNTLLVGAGAGLGIGAGHLANRGLAKLLNSPKFGPGAAKISPYLGAGLGAASGLLLASQEHHKGGLLQKAMDKAEREVRESHGKHKTASSLSGMDVFKKSMSAGFMNPKKAFKAPLATKFKFHDLAGRAVMPLTAAAVGAHLLKNFNSPDPERKVGAIGKAVGGAVGAGLGGLSNMLFGTGGKTLAGLTLGGALVGSRVAKNKLLGPQAGQR